MSKHRAAQAQPRPQLRRGALPAQIQEAAAWSAAGCLMTVGFLLWSGAGLRDVVIVGLLLAAVVGAAYGALRFTGMSLQHLDERDG